MEETTMPQIHETIQDLRPAVVADDVMPMLMLGVARLKQIAYGEERHDERRAARQDSEKDLSVEHVAVLGEN
jgi:hypothetical protein